MRHLTFNEIESLTIGSILKFESGNLLKFEGKLGCETDGNVERHSYHFRLKEKGKQWGPRYRLRCELVKGCWTGNEPLLSLLGQPLRFADDM